MTRNVSNSAMRVRDLATLRGIRIEFSLKKTAKSQDRVSSLLTEKDPVVRAVESTSFDGCVRHVSTILLHGRSDTIQHRRTGCYVSRRCNESW